MKYVEPLVKLRDFITFFFLLSHILFLHFILLLADNDRDVYNWLSLGSTLCAIFNSNTELN